MSIDVTIRQGFFGRKTMPLDVILGDRLHYGAFENGCLTVGKMGKDNIVAYDPKNIGRGFSVVWTPKEKRQIRLRLLHPSTRQEMEVFYEAVARMVRYWNASLQVDGCKVQLPDFLAGLPGMIQFNDSTVVHLSQQVLEQKGSVTLPSAMWPLVMGEIEASIFLRQPDQFARWLHEKQSVHAVFTVPYFIKRPEGLTGYYLLDENQSFIFPQTPAVPLGTIDAKGRPVKCSRWIVVAVLKKKNVILEEWPYDAFLRRLPSQKTERYDEQCMLIHPMTPEELQNFFGKRLH